MKIQLTIHSKMDHIKTHYQGDESKTIFNVAVLGDKSSGKTVLLDACCKHVEPWFGWPEERDIFEKVLEVSTSFGTIKINFIDYNKQPTDEQLGCLHGILLVQDITSQDTSYISKIAKKYRKIYPYGQVFLAGTKSDLYGEELFTLGHLQQLAQDIAQGASACIISAQQKSNIEFLLFMISDKLANPNQQYFAVENTQKKTFGKKGNCAGQ